MSSDSIHLHPPHYFFSNGQGISLTGTVTAIYAK